MAYTSMTCVSSFENGRNEKIFSVQFAIIIKAQDTPTHHELEILKLPKGKCKLERFVSAKVLD